MSVNRGANRLLLITIALVAVGCRFLVDDDYARAFPGDSLISTPTPPFPQLLATPVVLNSVAIPPTSTLGHAQPAPRVEPSTPRIYVRVMVPSDWMEQAAAALAQLSQDNMAVDWEISLDSDGADLWIQQGDNGFPFAATFDVLLVPFTSPWDAVTFDTASEILSNGHPQIEVGNWAGKRANQKVLRIDGKLPVDDGYALRHIWSVGARPGLEHLGFELATALRRIQSDGNPIHLSFVGDISLDRTLGSAIASGQIDYPFANVIGQLTRADLTIGNLESAIGGGGEPATKSYTFRAPGEAARSLKNAGFDILSLANNHAMDFGPENLVNGIDLLNAYGIVTIGAGRSITEARAPYLATIGSYTVAFLAYVSVPVEYYGFDTSTWTATVDSPGVAWADPALIAEDVRIANMSADLVIVVLHSGHEYKEAPSDHQVAAAEAAAEAGADLIVGHHAHILQGIQFYKESVIAYGIGNFAFNISGDPTSAIFDIWLDQAGVHHIDFTPVVIEPGGRPRLATDSEAKEIRARVYRLTALINAQ